MLRDLRDVGIARIGDTTGRFTVRLYVRNPAFEPLRIPSGGPPYRFAADPAESQGLSFSLRIASASSALQAGPGVDFWGAPAYVFEPRQTQVTEHEISLREWAARGAPLEPGTYRVRSYFKGHEGASASFRLVP